MTPIQIFGIVFATLLSFLLLRELLCWYFKINKRLRVLVDIRTELIEANKYINEDAAAEVLASNQNGTKTKPKESFWRAE
tara:strand:+ start:313 stop:552 length:240 start_codon:yes stop_codon:yes gene_type:complete